MQMQLNKLFNKVNQEKYDKYLELIPDFKKEKTQKFTTVVLTIIAIIILAIFAINPTLSTIANLQKQLDDAKFVTTKLDEKINNLSILQTKYNSIQADLPVVYEAIPKSSQVPKLTGQIQSIAQNSNLSIVSFQVSEISTAIDKQFSYYTFNINVQGNYQNMIDFLDQLISMQRITDISTINMSQSAGAITTLQLNLRGNAFFKE